MLHLDTPVTPYTLTHRGVESPTKNKQNNFFQKNFSPPNRFTLIRTARQRKSSTKNANDVQSTGYVADFSQMDKQRAEELIIQTRD
jgi:hypothetical protein